MQNESSKLPQVLSSRDSVYDAFDAKVSMKSNRIALDGLKPDIHKLQLINPKFDSVSELVFLAAATKNKVPLKYAFFILR
jgi:hypothetical protein